MSEQSIAGNFVIGDGLPQHEVPMSTWPFTSEADLRRFIRAEVHKALDDLAKEIRYGRAFQPASTQPRKQAGTCWACLGAGGDMEWFSREGMRGLHLIHKSEECRRIAMEKTEIREHRR